MNKRAVEYIKNAKRNDLPDGMKVLQEGIDMGNKITFGRSPFLDEVGFDSYYDYKWDCARNGKQFYGVFMGVASLEEQIEACKQCYEFRKKTGVEFSVISTIASPVTALPKEYRDAAPGTTSFVLNDYEDYEKIINSAPLMMFFEDHHLSSPNAIQTTINGLKAGSERLGLISQFIWGQPGYTDDKEHMINLVKSIGMVASKRKQHVHVDTYMDDGFPGYAMDCVTYVGYALLEHYIVTELCGAKMTFGWGGLLLDILPRYAIGLAIHKLLTTEEDLALSYLNGSTVYQWADEINSNFGQLAQEQIWAGLLTKKYKMGLEHNCIAVTEKLRVPSAQGLIDAVGVSSRALEKSEDWEHMINWQPLEELAEKLMQEGQKFFKNTLDIMEKAGVNIHDPLDMFMTLKNLDPSKFEATFHHLADENGSFDPVVPTVLGRQTVAMQEKTIEELKEKGLKGDELKSLKIALASGDGHSYGLLFMNNILSEFGAEIVNGGVDVDAASLLDLADEEEINVVGVSVHNGQCLDYSKQLMELAAKRGKKYNVILGGMLNAMLPGEPLPVDVTELVRETGVFGSNDLYEDITKLQEWM